jgi:hypothetical protein
MIDHPATYRPIPPSFGNFLEFSGPSAGIAVLLLGLRQA